MSELLTPSKSLLTDIELGTLDGSLVDIQKAISKRLNLVRKTIREAAVEAFKDSNIRTGDIIQLAFQANGPNVEYFNGRNVYYPAPPSKWDGRSVVFVRRNGVIIEIAYPGYNCGTAQQVINRMRNTKYPPWKRATDEGTIRIWDIQGFERFKIVEDL